MVCFGPSSIENQKRVDGAGGSRNAASTTVSHLVALLRARLLAWAAMEAWNCRRRSAICLCVGVSSIPCILPLPSCSACVMLGGYFALISGAIQTANDANKPLKASNLRAIKILVLSTHSSGDGLILLDKCCGLFPR